MTNSDDDRVSRKEEHAAVDPIGTEGAPPDVDPEGRDADRSAAQPASRTGVPAPKPGQTKWLVVAVAAVVVLLLLFLLF